MPHRRQTPLDSDPAWQSHGEADTPAPRGRPASWWQRLSQSLVRRPPPEPARERTSGELTTLPGLGRGQLLRDAHRGLRLVMRQQRGLRRVLPHLYFVERALAQRGSMALLDVPVLVLQRALQQLDRLSAGPDGGQLDREHLHVLRHRLTEAIGLRSRHRAGAQAVADSFSGDLDTLSSGRGPLSTQSGGLGVFELPHAVYDDLAKGRPAPSDGPRPTPRRR